MRRLFTLTGLFLIVLGIASCFKDGTLNLTNGLVFNVNAKLLPAPITVSFVNADPAQNSIPDNIYLDIFGEDAGNLSTPTGNGNLVVVGGLVNFGIQNGVSPSLNRPLKFGISAQAPGYFPATYFISLNNPDIPQYVTVYLVEEGNYPSGVSGLQEVHQVASTGFTSTQNLLTPLSNGKQERVKVRFDSGTRLFTGSNDALVTGNVQVSLVHYDNRSAVSRRTTSGLTEAIPAKDMQGADLGEVTFYTASFYDLGLNAGSIQVDRFSKPVEVTATLNPETFNPATGQNIKTGDQLSFWRFEATQNAWIEAGQTTVYKSEGKLVAVFQQDRPGIWLLGQAAQLCKTGATLTINSNIPQGACDRFFFTTLVDVNTGRPLSAKWSDNYLTLTKARQITLGNLPEGAIGKLQVWEGVKGCEGQLLAESQPFQACSGAATVNLTALNTNGWLPVTVNLKGYCEIDGERATLMPEFQLMYRPAGCGVYGLLGEFADGTGCIATLKTGQTYDFKTRIGEKTYEFINVPLENGLISYQLDNGDNALIRVETSPGGASLSFEELPLPSDFCDLIE